MKLVYTINNQSKIYIMNTFSTQYNTAKNNSKEFMKNGQITAYFNALLEMNKYKKLMIAVVSN